MTDLEMNVSMSLPLGTVNFILETLNKNPLSAPVMEVASLINLIQDQVAPQTTLPTIDTDVEPE